MVDFKKSPSLLKAQKQYKKLLNRANKTTLDLERVLSGSDCYECEIYYKDSELPFEERYARCGDCKFAAKVGMAHRESIMAFEECDRFAYECYAKEIFELLSPIKPRLIVRKDKSVVAWDSVFPENFDELSPKLRKSLISIVEEDGGRYRVAK